MGEVQIKLHIFLTLDTKCRWVVSFTLRGKAARAGGSKKDPAEIRNPAAQTVASVIAEQSKFSAKRRSSPTASLHTTAVSLVQTADTIRIHVRTHLSSYLIYKTTQRIWNKFSTGINRTVMLIAKLFCWCGSYLWVMAPFRSRMCCRRFRYSSCLRLKVKWDWVLLYGAYYHTAAMKASTYC
jgi:hypothetical protein